MIALLFFHAVRRFSALLSPRFDDTFKAIANGSAQPVTTFDPR